MPIPAVELVREMFSGNNRRPSVALLTSSICLSAWYCVGNYQFWAAYLTDDAYANGGTALSPGVAALLSSVLLLGIVPMAVVRFVFREKLAKYGLRFGNLRFALVCSLLAAPLLVLIGYWSSHSLEFRAAYPADPSALKSVFAITLHLAEQIVFYAAWEFHFRGFLQNALKGTTGLATAIWMQTLASTIAHFGKPAPEVFGSIVGGVLWGALAWRTRSILAGIFQHWLLGASLAYFIFRSMPG